MFNSFKKVPILSTAIITASIMTGCGGGDSSTPSSTPNSDVITLKKLSEVDDGRQLPITVYAESDVDDKNLKHVANIIANYLDNDANGQWNDKLSEQLSERSDAIITEDNKNRDEVIEQLKNKDHTFNNIINEGNLKTLSIQNMDLCEEYDSYDQCFALRRLSPDRLNEKFGVSSYEILNTEPSLAVEPRTYDKSYETIFRMIADIGFKNNREYRNYYGPGTPIDYLAGRLTGFESCSGEEKEYRPECIDDPVRKEKETYAEFVERVLTMGSPKASTMIFLQLNQPGDDERLSLMSKLHYLGVAESLGMFNEVYSANRDFYDVARDVCILDKNTLRLKKYNNNRFCEEYVDYEVESTVFSETKAALNLWEQMYMGIPGARGWALREYIETKGYDKEKIDVAIENSDIKHDLWGLEKPLERILGSDEEKLNPDLGEKINPDLAALEDNELNRLLKDSASGYITRIPFGSYKPLEREVNWQIGTEEF